MSENETPLAPINLLTQGKEIENILREAGRQARIRHKKLGHPIVSWHDGKVVIIPPEEITVEDEEPPG